MIKLRIKPNNKSEFIPLSYSPIRRVRDYQSHSMVAAIHIDHEGNVFYYTDAEMINQPHPRFALPYIIKTFAKYRV